MLLWQSIGFCFTAILGTLLHYAYSWSGSNFIALFSAVNESTWEHMKLIFFPMFFFALIEGFFVGKDCKSFWCIKFNGIIISLLTVPIAFYTLNGAFGTTSGIANIAIFFVSIAFGYIYETVHFKINKQCDYYLLAIALLCVISLAFFVYTFNAPHIPLFKDPITGQYGI